jgi:hypothetical protein
MKIEDMDVAELLALAGQDLVEENLEPIETMVMVKGDTEYTEIDAAEHTEEVDPGSEKIEVPSQIISDLEKAIARLNDAVHVKVYANEYCANEVESRDVLNRVLFKLKGGTRDDIIGAQIAMTTGMLSSMSDMPDSVFNFISTALNMN